MQKDSKFVNMGEQVVCRIEMFSISVFSESCTINICYFYHQRRKINFTYFFKFTGGHGQRSAFRQSSAPAEEPQHTQRTQCELTLPGSWTHVMCLSLGAPHERASDGAYGQDRTFSTDASVSKCHTYSSIREKHAREHSCLTQLGFSRIL